ncbi:MAG: acetyl-CoA carboxylase biotin carboxyl carrier protein, partial [Gammaproteobacteria bacterium]|nr:acetyl-CoA carboxylase biotin carboxyl carrier protein [Gammaproteobacteria bacterium]
MDLRKIKKLIELLEESALIEMEITEGDNTIRLSRAGRPAPATIPHEHAVTVGPAIGETPPSEQTGSLADEFPGGTVVESPMVGTYYNAPSPEADPFVEVGST